VENSNEEITSNRPEYLVNRPVIENSENKMRAHGEIVLLENAGIASNADGRWRALVLRLSGMTRNGGDGAGETPVSYLDTPSGKVS